METQLDKNGQPRVGSFNASRRLERDISEMLGLAKGTLADGRVVNEEVDVIRRWIASRPDSCETWPGDILAQRLERIFADGKVSKAEREDLQELLTDLVGGKAGLIGSENSATSLPLDKPAPKIKFTEHAFVFTGKFAFGPRSECQRFTMESGGFCEDIVTTHTDYLVIGTFGSRDWIQTSHGRKIEKVLQYRTKGHQIAIVGEDHWASSLPSTTT